MTAQPPPEGADVLDPVSRLLLAEAPDDAPDVALVETATVLDAEARRRWQRVRTYRDRVDAGPSEPDLPSAVDGADLVLLSLPASLTALDEIAQTIAAHAAPGVHVVTAGRVKHMTPRQNDVLARSFDEVAARRGVGKCRAVVAAGPRPSGARWPRVATEPTTGLVLAAHGATFGGARLDPGTRLLLSTADRWRPGDAADIGCGNGVLTAVLARQGRDVISVDISRAAVEATRETLRRNKLRADVLLADGTRGLPAASRSLVVTNPPFHVGTAKDSSAALDLLADAPRVLAPGGELWCVYNSHLPYLRAARAAFGPDARVTVVAQDRAFTVLRARATG